MGWSQRCGHPIFFLAHPGLSKSCKPQPGRQGSYPRSYCSLDISPTDAMLKLSPLILTAAALWLASFGAQAALYKCVANGKVTYQERPCPSGDGGPRPTVQEMNAREKQRRAASAASAAATASAAARFEEPAPAMPASTVQSPAATAAAGGFRCDGRKMCSQMTSCAEAKYFLANCPGVKMVGNKDGTPCEQQWCGR